MTITITIADKAINQTFADVTGTTSGGGSGAKFSVTKTNGVYNATVTTTGTGYLAGDTITIPGTDLGGTTDNNLIVTIGTVGTNGAVATFGSVGTGRMGDGVIDVIVDVTGTSSVDTYTVGGKRADFNLSLGNDSIIASSKLARVDFNLNKHERVAFSDKAVAYDTNGVAGEVYSLLGAALGVADITPELLGKYMYQRDIGMSSTAVAQQLLSSNTYKNDAGGVSNETFIKHVFSNVFGRQATFTEVSELVAVMEAGQYSQAAVLNIAAKVTVFQDTIDLVGLRATGLEYIPYV